jgi:O-methyltransferase
MSNFSIRVEDIIDKNDIISNMMTYWQIVSVLRKLQYVLENKIPGDIVELGCNVGTTTIYIRKLLDLYGSDKQLHVYDSWEGLPEKHQNDLSNKKMQFNQGSCKTNKEIFIENFYLRNLKLPIIHNGWFAELPMSEYPNKICFAFFDGDFYTSILDSFMVTYYKIQPGGIIIIDDCGWEVLPGVEKACRDFLQDKEELHMDGYCNDNGIEKDGYGGGYIIKKNNISILDV